MVCCSWPRGPAVPGGLFRSPQFPEAPGAVGGLHMPIVCELGSGMHAILLSLFLLTSVPAFLNSLLRVQGYHCHNFCHFLNIKLIRRAIRSPTEAPSLPRATDLRWSLPRGGPSCCGHDRGSSRCFVEADNPCCSANCCLLCAQTPAGVGTTVQWALLLLWSITGDGPESPRVPGPPRPPQPSL